MARTAKWRSSENVDMCIIGIQVHSIRCALQIMQHVVDKTQRKTGAVNAMKKHGKHMREREQYKVRQELIKR